MKLTLKKFCEQSHLPESLIRATVRQAGGWDAFTQSAKDVTNHGADGGFRGFIYHAETVPFAKRNRESILQACREMADDLGEPGAYSIIAGFNCLKMTVDDAAEAVNNSRNDDHTQAMNALAWFALEEVSHSYCDAIER